MVKEETKKLETSAKYKLSLLILKTFWTSCVIIQSLNIQSLNQHYHDIIVDPNLQASHILCFNETRINNMEAKCIVTLINHKFSILSCSNGHGTIVLYDKNNTLNAHETHTKNGIEVIATT